MNRPCRTAAIITLWAAYGALWVVVAMIGRPSTTSPGALRWVLSAAATLLLTGTLFVVGLLRASRVGASAAESKGQVLTCATVVAAVVTVGALLGLVAFLRVLVFGGPDWVTCLILGLAAGEVVIGSGPAMGWAALGGRIWGGLGLWSGIGQDPIWRVDLILTSLLVGAMAGAAGWTLWGS